MEEKIYDSIVRLDSNKKQFCISECVKKLKENLNEKENLCLNSCFETYERALNLAFDFDSKRK